MLLKKYSKGKRGTVRILRLRNTHLEIFPEPHSFTQFYPGTIVGG